MKESVGSPSFTTLSEKSFPRGKQWILYKFESYWEYLMITFSSSFATENFFSFVIITGDKAESTIIHYAVSYIFIGVPLNYMQVMLGQYSQLGVLSVKQLSPLGHGIGYVMVLISLFYCSIHAVELADCVMYFLASFEPVLFWLKCPNGTEHRCWGVDSTCVENCVNKTVETSSFIYWKETYLDHPNFDSINMSFKNPAITRIVPLLIIWGVIFFVVTTGINKYKKLIRVNLYLTWICCTALILVILIAQGASKGVGRMFSVNLASLVDHSAWCYAILDVLHILALGRACHVLYGSYMQPSMSADILCIVGGSLNFIGTLLTSMITNACLGIITASAGINPNNLIYVWKKGDSPALTTITMALGFMGVPQLWTMVYFAMCMFVLVNSIVTQVDGIERSISDAYTRIRVYKNYMLATVCLICATCSILILSKDSFAVIQEFFNHPTVQSQGFSMLIMSVLTFWIYRVQRLSDDIHFLQGAQPAKFWKIAWYIMPGFLAYSFAKIAFLDYFGHVMYLIHNLGYIFIVLPIPVMVIYEIFRYLKIHNLMGLLQPEERWGPPDPQERHLRRLFNPRQEIRSRRRDDTCQHKCLLGSKHLKIAETEEKEKRQASSAMHLATLIEEEEAGTSRN